VEIGSNYGDAKGRNASLDTDEGLTATQKVFKAQQRRYE